MARAGSLDGAIRQRAYRWVTALMALIATISAKDGAASRYPAWPQCAPCNLACLTGNNFCRKTHGLEVKLAFRLPVSNNGGGDGKTYLRRSRTSHFAEKKRRRRSAAN